eukprot:9439393-Alexandrium_andersonii.AAC.1
MKTPFPTADSLGGKIEKGACERLYQTSKWPWLAGVGDVGPPLLRFRACEFRASGGAVVR